MIEQWYATNTKIKFPLDPFHEGPVPDDMLLDMAVSVPANTEVWLTNLIVTDKFVFLSLEDTSGGAVGHVVQAFPSVSSIVHLTMAADGFGWVVFGPGVLEYPREYKDIRIKLDDSALLPDVPAVNPFELSVDGKSYPRPDILNIRPLDYMTSEETDNLLKLIRADDRLTGDMDVTLFTSQDYSADVVNFINGVGPDVNGNIVLAVTHNVGVGTVTEIKRTPDDTIIGLLISTAGMTDCSDETERLKEKLLCRNEYGITYQLPLDWVNCPGTDICPPFSVYYSGNGNTGGDAPVDLLAYAAAATVTVKTNTGSLVKSGFTFDGWNTEPDGSGTARSPGSTFTISSFVSLFAQWSPV